MYIGGEVRTGQLGKLTPPHEHGHVLGHYHIGDESHVKAAVDSALAARKQWGAMPGAQSRNLLKAAELISTKYRYKINACYDVRKVKLFPSRD